MISPSYSPYRNYSDEMRKKIPRLKSNVNSRMIRKRNAIFNKKINKKSRGQGSLNDETVNL